jgi:hypothetical protein
MSKVVIIKVSDDSGEPDRIFKVGSAHEVIKADLVERLGTPENRGPDWLKSINRIDMDKHIDEMAGLKYSQQFHSRVLGADLLNEIFSGLDVGCEMALTCEEITEEEWAEAERRGEEEA